MHRHLQRLMLIADEQLIKKCSLQYFYYLLVINKFMFIKNQF